MGIPMLKIRRSRDHLIFNMGIPILVRWHIYIEMPPSPRYQLEILHITFETVLRRMPRDLADDWSTSVHAKVWCRQVTSHYLNQCWPKSMSPYGVTRYALYDAAARLCSKWERGFHCKLRCHWLEGVRQRQIAAMMQDPWCFGSDGKVALLMQRLGT